ncbi:MAG: MBOAT family protein [Clostridia bacterium]|nr:MBOAT family protein [Clostridia bacterium]
MVFSSLFFIFAFLVLCYGVYLFAPTVKAKNTVLLVFSLIFYAWGGPPLVLLLCLETLICFVGAHLIWSCHPAPFHPEGGWGGKKAFLAVTVGMCLGLLVIYKYTGFFTDTFCALFGLENLIPKVALPIGISFYTFQLISYVADVYRGETPPQRSYAKLLLYAALFHQCIAGPIVRYVDVQREIDRRTMSLDEAWSGMLRFTVGLGKKAVLANTCATVADSLLNPEKLGGGQVSSLAVLLGVTAYMLQIYLDFSAYSDMAIGMGRMIGFHFKENFNYPYAADSVTDFWRRWHISLSSFFRDYVYIPLGGNRCSKGRHILNLLIVWALTGFWHGASWNFILWGVYFVVFLILEKYVFRWKKHGNAFTSHLRRIYTLIVVWFGWFLFRFDDMSLMGQALRSLFGANNGFNGDNAHYTLKSYLFILMVAVLACAPIVPVLSKKLTAAAEREGVAGGLARAVTNTVAVAAPIALLILSALALVGDSYNPFLYFRF